MKYLAIAASLIAAINAASLGNTEYALKAGEPFTIKWYGAQGEVTLDLRNGASDDLKQLITIVAGATSDEEGIGSFTWPVPSTLGGDGPYAIVITDNLGVNYSPQFPIEGAAVDEDEDEDKETTTTPEPSSTAEPTSTKSSASANNVKPTHTFEFQSSSSVAPTTSATKTGTSTTLSKTTTDSKSKTTETNEPTTVPDGEDSAAPHMASPLALILVSVAAMFYLQ